MEAAAALEALLDGNARYVSDQQQSPRRLSTNRHELEKSQHPFAVILTCADSRVIPELIFDQGIGDLFTIRVAGNVANPDVIGSIEYAAAHLGTQLVVVLGHQSCGAVAAAISDNSDSPHIRSLVDSIRPAIAENGGKVPDVDTVVKAHARRTAETLAQTEPILKSKVAEKTLQVVPAFYHLEGGHVELLVSESFGQ